MRLLAVIKEPASIARTLAAVGEASELPRRSPRRGPPPARGDTACRGSIGRGERCGRPPAHTRQRAG